MESQGNNVSVVRNRRKSKIGIVSSNKMDKTIVVLFQGSKVHALYGKVVKTTMKVMAHDEKNECSIGDKVEVMETRPLSRRKRWRLVRIIEKAQ